MVGKDIITVMKNIAVLTATRAEYGLLSPIIKGLMNSDGFHVKVVVTGAHLSPEFGLTYKEIENDGIEIDRKIEILLSSDTPAAISKSMGMAMIGFADYFAESKPDALMVLGDRYETLAVCCAAMNARIPIIHLYGGETTEGAVDEAIRHAITKLSYLHLTSTEDYRKRVIQLGEHPNRVFTVGAIGTENALKQPLMSKAELEDSLGMNLDKPYAVVTFHPVTLEGNSAEQQCGELLKSFDANSDMIFIATKANADADGRIINRMMEEYAKRNVRVKVFDSLGMCRYLSAVKYAELVLGNSSSGISEVPSLRVPTVNIGDRQKGRQKAISVIDCEPSADAIGKAIKLARDSQFRKELQYVTNPYEKLGTAELIIKHIKDMFERGIDLKKQFYDISKDEMAN